MDFNLDDDDGGGGEEGAPAWMATFSDLATLLLTFFVLLLSFAEMDVQEFRSLLGSIRDAFGVTTALPGPLHAASTEAIELDDETAAEPSVLESSLLGEIRRFVAEHDMEDDVEILMTEEGVLVRLKDALLFATGSARLKEEAAPILSRIGDLAKAFPGGLSIEGHTDDMPISNREFPSNWELSTARATAALHYIQHDGTLQLKRVQVVGYADTVPIEPNATEEARARNRRVEFVFRRSAKPANGTDPIRNDIMK